MSYSVRQMREVILALQEQHEIWLDRVSVTCSTEIAAEIMQHLRSVQARRFDPFVTRCASCRLLLEHVELLR